MKIIFLDFDGVLNSTRTAIAFNGYGPGSRPGTDSYDENEIVNPKLDPVAVGMLRVLVEETGAKIVVSSTWRHYFTVDAFIKMFKVYYQWDAPIIGKTPRHFSMSGGRPRGGEIAEWLEEHPEVTNYVILDDSTDMFPEQIQNFVHTNPNNGISFEDFQKVQEILNPPITTINNVVKE